MTNAINIQNNNISKANKSFKWTAFAEILAKIIAPIINMVLARFISPEIFGIVATLHVVVGLAQTLSESGFARYIQQHQFKDDDERIISNKTSMTSSIAFGLILFTAIVIWRFPLSELIGSSGYENYLIVAAAAIPFHSIIAVETAILKRDFKFKKTAFIRIGYVLLLAAIEIVLGVLGYGLIALTWGQLISSAILSVALFFMLKDKRIIGFSFKSFKASFLDNALFIVESLCVWFISAVDILILGNVFGESLVGVYKLAFNTEKGIIALLGAIFSPVLISLLSKFSYEDPSFKKVISSYQKGVAFLSFPVGLGMLVFREGITNIFLGSGWEAAIPVFGFFALFDCIKTPISDFISTLMISKGKPLGSILAQLVYILFVVLCCSFAPQLGFSTFVILRASCTLVLVLAYTFLCKPFTGISPWIFYKNLLPPFLGSLGMALCCLPFLLIPINIGFTILGIITGSIVYFALMYFLFKKDFKNFFSIIFDKDFDSKNTFIVFKNKKMVLPSISMFFSLSCVLPIVVSASSLDSNRTAVIQKAEAFDICETANLKTENKLFRLDVTGEDNMYSAANKTLNSFFRFAQTHSKWPDYYNFYMTNINPLDSNCVVFEGKSIETNIVSFATNHVTSYAKNERGHFRFESAGLYTYFDPSVIKTTNTPVYISEKMANILIGNSDYEKLIGKEITINSNSFQIANVIVKESWLYDELERKNESFLITGSNKLSGIDMKIVCEFTNQPYVFNDFISLLSNEEISNEMVSLDVLFLSKDGWNVDVNHSKNLKMLIDTNKNNSFFIWNDKTVYSLLLLIWCLIVEIILLVFYCIKNVHFNFLQSIYQFICVFIFGGVFSTIGNLSFGRYYNFWLYCSFMPGLITILLSIAIPLICFSLESFLKARRKI